jgi:hypothetical protein
MVCEMSKGANYTFRGIFVLGLSMALWKITGSFEGWATLFTPGSIFVVMGLYYIFMDE